MSRLVELFVLGLSLGALYALMGTSVTIVYQVTRVPNVAFVGIGTAAAVLHWDLVTPGGRFGGGMSWWGALGPALLLAAVLGLLTDLLVRPVAGRVVPAFLLLAGWTAALLAGVNEVWGTAPKLLPRLWGGPALTVGDISVRRHQVAALGIAAACGLILVLLTRHTRFGLALRVSAEDPDGARLSGIDARRLSLAAWVGSSVIAAVAVILAVHPVLSNPYETTVYLPFAFGAALLAGFHSLPLAALGGIALGVVPTLLHPSDNLVRIGGVPNLVALVMIVILLLRRPMALRRDQDAAAPTPAPVPTMPPLPSWARRAVLVVLGLGLAVAVPVLSGSEALEAWTHGISVFLVCVSVVMVLGWAGDVALGQVAFAGLGAYMAANLAVRLDVPHILAVPLAVLSVLPVALVVGLPSLRARGRLPFAVVSVGLMVVASSLFWGPGSRWFTGDRLEIRRPDWMDALFGRPAVSYYLLCLGLAVGVVWFAVNLRSSRIGRALAAGRESDQTASAVGIDSSHYRLVILVFAAFVAALGGVLHAYLGGTIDPARFAAFLSVQYLLYAVVGGVGSLAGAAVMVFAFEVAPALDGGPGGSSPGDVVLLGMLAVACIRFVPDGLAGLARRAAAVLPGQRPTPAPVKVPTPETGGARGF